MKIIKHPKFEERKQLLIKCLDRLSELNKGSNKLVARQIIHIKRREFCELWTDQGEYLTKHYKKEINGGK